MWQPAVEAEEALPPAAEQDQLHDLLPSVKELGRAQPVAAERDQFGTPVRAAQPESVPSAAPRGELEKEQEDETQDTPGPPQTATSDAAGADDILSHEDGVTKSSANPAPASSPKPHTSARFTERAVGSGGPVWSGQIVRGLSPLGGLETRPWSVLVGPDIGYMLVTQAEDGTHQNVLILHTQPHLSSTQLTSPQRSSANPHNDVGIIFQGHSVRGPPTAVLASTTQAARYEGGYSHRSRLSQEGAFYAAGQPANWSS